MNIDQKEQVRDYLINNQEHFQELCKGLIEQKKELLKSRSELKQDIEDQFKWAASQIIAQEVSQNLSIDVLTILSILDRVQLDDYLTRDVIGVKNE